MKKDVEVLVIIICDQEPDNVPTAKDVSRIKKTITQMDGIKETYLAPKLTGSDIVAIASWDESDIPEKVLKIKAIEGVKKVDTKILVPA